MFENKENILSPSILAADFKVLGDQLRDIFSAGARYVHLDVMDGSFVPSISFGMPLIRSIRPATEAVFDVHLMIDEPIRYVKEFADCGADIITVHYEACEDPANTLRCIRELGCKAGLSIKPGTEVNVLAPFLGEADMILLMSVEPGFGGQKFLDGSLERAGEIARMIRESGYSPDLEIDGGINLENVRDVLKSGVNVIVAGSAVFRHPYENTKAFMRILQEEELQKGELL